MNNLRNVIFGIKSSLVLTINNSSNTIDDPYVRVCVSDKVKNMNVEVFDLISRVNEIQHESCECKCRLHDSLCNSNEM